MSKEHIVRYRKGMKSRTDWDRVYAMTDDDIDYSDCPPLDVDFFATAKLVWPPSKVSLGVRFDCDVVDWFKKQGSGYQTRMNAVLRTYMEAQKRLVQRAAAMRPARSKHKARKTVG